MNYITFPTTFPKSEAMMNTLLKTFQQSWRVNLDSDDVEAWLNNFTGSFFDVESERRIALWLLCNFTYYNEEEVNHLCRILYRNFLHQVMTDRKLFTTEEVECILRKTVFTAIGKASESGGLLLYHFRQEVGLSLEKFVFPTALDNSDCDIIVCIDDVMLSGGTATRFFYDNQVVLSGKTIYYLSILTSQEAIDKLEKLNIKVISCALLDERNKAFSDESLVFFKYPSLRIPAQQIAEGYGKLIEPKRPLGHRDGQFCFGFSYNTPNNCLPIFWSSNSWIPIMYRKEKYQNAKQEKRAYGYFI